MDSIAKKNSPIKNIKTVIKNNRTSLSKYINSTIKERLPSDHYYLQKIRLRVSRNSPEKQDSKEEQEFVYKRCITQPELAAQIQKERNRQQTDRNSFVQINRSRNISVHRNIINHNVLPSVNNKKSRFINMVQKQIEDEKNRKLKLKTQFRDFNIQCIDYSTFKCLTINKQPIQKVQLTDIIGAGASAQVRLAINQKSQKYAVKIYEKYKLFDQKKKKRVYQQIEILSSLNHPNIIKLLQAYEDKRQIHLIFEFVESSRNLQDTFRKNFGTLETNEINRIIRGVINGLKYLHNEGYAHRDIKPDNILVSENKIKIIDFGFATQQEKSQLYCGTPNFMAPQLYEKNICYETKKVDIWALGVMMYYLYENAFPFKGFNSKDLIRNIRQGIIQFKKTPISISEILQQLLIVEPENRICLYEIFI